MTSAVRSIWLTAHTHDVSDRRVFPRHRVAAGVRDGGQFVPTPHTEPDLTLAAPPSRREHNGDRVARENREYAAAKAAASAAAVPLDYDRDDRPFAHYGAVAVVGGNGQPVAVTMTAITLDRAINDALDRAIDDPLEADEGATARAAVRAMTPHVPDTAFEATWADLWVAASMAYWWENDPCSASEANPDDDDFGASWTHRRYLLSEQLAADEAAAART